MVESKSERQNFLKKLGIDNAQFGRFEKAVHNPSATGDFARHAIGKKQGVENPMTKEEAESFIRDMVNKWLQSLRKSFKKPLV